MKKFSLSDILVGLLYFILGVVFIAATEELIKTFNYVLVSICMVIGFMQILQFIISKKYLSDNYTDLFIGIVFIWVSLILYVYYGFMINILPILFSLYMFILACNFLIKYLNSNRDKRYKKYIWLFLIAVIIGLLLIFNPGSIILIYLKVTGIYLILIGVLHFVDYFNELKGE